MINVETTVTIVVSQRYVRDVGTRFRKNAKSVELVGKRLSACAHGNEQNQAQKEGAPLEHGFRSDKSGVHDGQESRANTVSETCVFWAPQTLDVPESQGIHFLAAKSYGLCRQLIIARGGLLLEEECWSMGRH